MTAELIKLQGKTITDNLGTAINLFNIDTVDQLADAKAVGVVGNILSGQLTKCSKCKVSKGGWIPGINDFTLRVFVPSVPKLGDKQLGLLTMDEMYTIDSTVDIHLQDPGFHFLFEPPCELRNGCGTKDCGVYKGLSRIGKPVKDLKSIIPVTDNLLRGIFD